MLGGKSGETQTSGGQLSNLARLMDCCKCNGPRSSGSDERQVHRGFGHGGSCPWLSPLLPSNAAVPLDLAEVNGGLFLELISDVINQDLIKIITTQVAITIGSQHFEDAIADVKNRDVEGSPAQVEHRNSGVGLLVEAVGQGRGRSLMMRSTFNPAISPASLVACR